MENVIVGASQQSLVPKIHQKSERGRTKQRKRQNRQALPGACSSMTPSSLAPSSAPGCTSPSGPASPPPWASGASALGALRSQRGGGWVCHPLAIWRASRFLAQASARAPWGPPQLAHLAIVCGQWCPRPTRHPSTEHLWSVVWWSFAHMAHRGAVAWQWGVMCPHSLHLPQKASGRQTS